MQTMHLISPAEVRELDKLRDILIMINGDADEIAEFGNEDCDLDSVDDIKRLAKNMAVWADNAESVLTSILNNKYNPSKSLKHFELSK